MSIWSYWRGPSLDENGDPIKTRAQRLDEQLSRIEADLVKLTASVEQSQRRLDKIEVRQGDEAMQQPWGVVEVVSKGDLADRMMQFMTALSITHHAGGGRITGVHLPEWRITHETIPSDGQQSTREGGQFVPVQRLARMLRECLVERVVLDGPCRSVGNFLPPESYRGLFDSDPNVGRQADDGSLLIHVHGVEALDAPHPDHCLVPIEFYAEVIAKTGLKPVFMGQLTETPYIEALRARFPDAIYWESGGELSDLATMLKAKHIVPAISTMSWLAAWLSDATEIVLPLSGLTNPFQSPAQDFVPRADPRYSLYLFPINYAVPADHYQPAHDAMSGRWRAVKPDEITILRGQVPSEPRKLAEYQAIFDEQYYLRVWPDVSDGVNAGWLRSGYSHFAGPGFSENRHAFDLDPVFYSVAYPDAAEAVGRGRYLDLWHYHARVGHARGNLLRMPSAE